MSAVSEPLLLALDSGTSMVKAVAFTASGEVVASASRPNLVDVPGPAQAEQDQARTWADAATVLTELAAKLEGQTLAALAVTGQGDGTWLVDAQGGPVGPALLWLDARSAGLVEHLHDTGAARGAFVHTGTGLNACQQSAQLLWLQAHDPARLSRAAWALHCKDFLYLNLTGIAASDPSEAAFTWGDYRTRDYRDDVLHALGAQSLRPLLPPILDGTRASHPLLPAVAARLGMPAGLPVVLAYVDVVCTGLGAGLYGAGARETGVSVLGSTGMHLRLVRDAALAAPSPEGTGYCMPFPVPGAVMQAQSTMAVTLSMDWLAELLEAASLAASGSAPDRRSVLGTLDRLAADARPGAAVYHPFISSSGERGPFRDADARASLIGFDQSTRLPELARSVYEGIGLAARDCYGALGGVPDEVRATGGGGNSATMRAILASCLDRPVRGAAHTEAGAAGAAMIAAVSVGLVPDMAACAERWLQRGGLPEQPDPALAAIYDGLFPIYRDGYAAMKPLWRRLREARHAA